MPDTPYSIVTISILCLVFYGISLALIRPGIITAGGQRKFWNTLLLFSFFIAGGIGLFLAIAVNFKINLPFAGSLLVWHVDFGTALALMAVFHFSWHIKYYLSLFKPGSKSMNDVPGSGPVFSLPQHKAGFNLLILPFSLGFTSMATQLILLRELLSVFNGNEWIIGIVLANWMGLTGLGALANRNKSGRLGLKGIMTGLYLLAIIPGFTLFLLDWIRNIILPTGSYPTSWQILSGTSLLLMPFCLMSGWLFGAVSLNLSHGPAKNAVSLVYGWETAGSITAGILCSLVLVFFFEPFQSMSVVLMINSILLFFGSRNKIFPLRKKISLYVLLASGITLAVLVSKLDRTALQFLFPGQEIVTFKDTPYGKLAVTEQAGQLNFFEDNTLLFTTNNITLNEETVHYTLLQRPLRGNLLLLGGSISGVADECLKYPLKRLDCFEINPAIPAMGKVFHRLPTDTRFKMHTGDARLLLKQDMVGKTMPHLQGQSQAGETVAVNYDAVILDLPLPATLRLNRFYTLEFFGLLKRLLLPGGILSLSLTSTADYMGSDALAVQSTMYQTLRAEFNNILVIPGGKNYFLASDGPLTSAVSKLAAARGIETAYVNEYYLDDVSLLERSGEVMKRISADAPLNRDFKPVGCFRQLKYWLSYPGNAGSYLLALPVIVLLLLGGIRSGASTVALFTAGLSSFSIEIILLLSYQVVYGYIYVATGIFITFFMAGIALGVLLSRRYSGKLTFITLIYLQLALLSIIFLSLAVLYSFSHFMVSTALMHIQCGMLILCTAAVTGALFHVASYLKTGTIQEVASANYSADLFGSALGAALVNVWIIPVWGLVNSLWVVAGFNALALIIMTVKKKRG